MDNVGMYNVCCTRGQCVNGEYTWKAPKPQSGEILITTGDIPSGTEYAVLHQRINPYALQHLT